MECLRARGEAMSVRRVLEQLNSDRDLAYTTVMTVLDNLHRKGIAERDIRTSSRCARGRSTAR